MWGSDRVGWEARVTVNLQMLTSPVFPGLTSNCAALLSRQSAFSHLGASIGQSSEISPTLAAVSAVSSGPAAGSLQPSSSGEGSSSHFKGCHVKENKWMWRHKVVLVMHVRQATAGVLAFTNLFGKELRTIILYSAFWKKGVRHASPNRT